MFFTFFRIENFRTFAISQLYFTHTTKIRQEKVKVWLLLNVRNFKLLWGDDVAVHNRAWKTLVSSLEFFLFFTTIVIIIIQYYFCIYHYCYYYFIITFFLLIVLLAEDEFVTSLTLSGASSWTQWPQRGNTCIWNLPLNEYRRVSIIRKNCHSNKKILYHIN